MRLVFEKIEEFEEWIKKKAISAKYDIYITSEKEIVFLPVKSTRPILYSYIKLAKDEDLGSLETEFRNKGFSVFKVKTIDWADDRAIGIRM